MFCTNCGKELSDNMRFCIFCGVQLVKEEVRQSVPEVAPVSVPVVSGGSQSKKGLLVLVDAADNNKFYGCDLTDRPIILGREENGCDIVIKGDKSISRKHCRFFCQGGFCYVEDLQSVNHTFLNGAMVESPQRIQAGDHLKFGMAEVTVAECELGG